MYLLGEHSELYAPIFEGLTRTIDIIQGHSVCVPQKLPHSPSFPDSNLPHLNQRANAVPMHLPPCTYVDIVPRIRHDLWYTGGLIQRHGCDHEVPEEGKICARAPEELVARPLPGSLGVLRKPQLARSDADARQRNLCRAFVAGWSICSSQLKVVGVSESMDKGSGREIRTSGATTSEKLVMELSSSRRRASHLLASRSSQVRGAMTGALMLRQSMGLRSIWQCGIEKSVQSPSDPSMYVKRRTFQGTGLPSILYGIRARTRWSAAYSGDPRLGRAVRSKWRVAKLGRLYASFCTNTGCTMPREQPRILRVRTKGRTGRGVDLDTSPGCWGSVSS